MAKIRPSSFVEGVSGKLSEREDIYFRTNRRTGKVQIVAFSHDKMNNRKTTTAQLSSRQRFIERNREATAWYHSIKPTSSHPGNPELWQALTKAFAAQNKIGNIYTFAIKYYNEINKFI